ncbi:hypothetical protein IV102_04365 [bacterium]|nr:hypothetical protein [bacterium]
MTIQTQQSAQAPVLKALSPAKSHQAPDAPKDTFEPSSPVSGLIENVVLGALQFAAPAALGSWAGTPGIIGAGVVGAGAGMLGTAKTVCLLGAGGAALALAGSAFGTEGVIASAALGALVGGVRSWLDN